jgi:ankyrin repeat protein
LRPDGDPADRDAVFPGQFLGARGQFALGELAEKGKDRFAVIVAPAGGEFMRAETQPHFFVRLFHSQKRLFATIKKQRAIPPGHGRCFPVGLPAAMAFPQPRLAPLKETQRLRPAAAPGNDQPRCSVRFQAKQVAAGAWTPDNFHRHAVFPGEERIGRWRDGRRTLACGDALPEKIETELEHAKSFQEKEIRVKTFIRASSMKTLPAIFILFVGLELVSFSRGQLSTNGAIVTPPPFDYPLIKNPLSSVNSALPDQIPVLNFTKFPGAEAKSSSIIERFEAACTDGNLELAQNIEQEAVTEEKQDPVVFVNTAAGSYEMTPLMCAVRHPEIVHYLLGLGARPDARDSKGNTALRDACFYDQIGTVQTLLDAGANPNLPTFDGRLPLMDAAVKGDDALVTLLLTYHADVNGDDDAGPALWRAVGHDHISTVKLLLDAGADLKLRPNPLKPGRRYWSLLGQAISNKHLDVIDFLLAHGVGVDDPAADGTTALMDAAAYNQLVALKKLLAAGAAVDQTDENGQTALMVAAGFADEFVLQTLLDHHANLEAKDKLGRTPLIYACRHPRGFTVRFLLNHGADPNAADVHGETALTYAGDQATPMSSMCSRSGAPGGPICTLSPRRRPTLR